MIRLRRLAADAGLTEVDVELLVISLVPDLDSRFERLYGYLNDDVTRRRATVGLALRWSDQPSASAAARARLLPGAPLIDRALLQVEDADRPFLTRALRVPDRVTAHLLGDDAPDPELTGLLTAPEPFAGEQTTRLAAALSAGQWLSYIREAGIGIGPSVAGAALAATGRPVLGVDLARVADTGNLRQTVTVLGREALLRGAGVVAGPVEALAAAGSATGAAALRQLTDLPVPVIIVGTVTWDPGWTDSVPLLIEAPTLSPTERTALWTAALNGSGVGTDAEVPVHFVLGPVRWAGLFEPRRRPPWSGRRGRERYRRRPAARCTRAECGRPGTARPAYRAGGRLGRHRAARRLTRASCTTSPPGRGIGTGC